MGLSGFQSSLAGCRGILWGGVSFRYKSVPSTDRQVSSHTYFLILVRAY